MNQKYNEMKNENVKIQADSKVLNNKLIEVSY